MQIAPKPLGMQAVFVVTLVLGSDLVLHFESLLTMVKYGFYRKIQYFKMAKNIKDFEYYSDDNPFMMYHGDQSYCNKCKRFFVKKHGGQSHSSKIHHITLDGRKLNPKKDKKNNKVISEIKPDNSKIVSNENNSSSEDESHRKTIKDADMVIALNLKINQLENMGLVDYATELRIQNNIFSQQKPEKPADTIPATMLLALWNNETDAARKNLLFQLYAMKSGGASDDDIIDMMSMHMLCPPADKPAEQSETEKQLELQLVSLAVKNMNRDPLDDLFRIQKSTGKTNSGSLDDFALRLKKLKEPKMTHVGILPAPATGPVLPSEKRTVPFLINHNRKIPPVKQVFPMGGDIFSKDSHGMYFEFDESVYHDDLNMARNLATPLDYADMSIPDAVSN